MSLVHKLFKVLSLFLRGGDRQGARIQSKHGPRTKRDTQRTIQDDDEVVLSQDSQRCLAKTSSDTRTMLRIIFLYKKYFKK